MFTCLIYITVYLLKKLGYTSTKGTTDVTQDNLKESSSVCTDTSTVVHADRNIDIFMSCTTGGKRLGVRSGEKSARLLRAAETLERSTQKTADSLKHTKIYA